MAKIKNDPRYKTLREGGLDHESAVSVLGLSDANPGKPEKLTKKQRKAAEALLEAQADERSEDEKAVDAAGFKFTSGRVYFDGTGSMVEAVVRVTKGGKSEIVNTSGNGRTKAVLVTRTESGDVSVQNLAAQV